MCLQGLLLTLFTHLTQTENIFLHENSSWSNYIYPSNNHLRDFLLLSQPISLSLSHLVHVPELSKGLAKQVVSLPLVQLG